MANKVQEALVVVDTNTLTQPASSFLHLSEQMYIITNDSREHTDTVE